MQDDGAIRRIEGIEKRQRIMNNNVEKLVVQQKDMMDKLDETSRACAQIYKLLKSQESNVNRHKVYSTWESANC